MSLRVVREHPAGPRVAWGGNIILQPSGLTDNEWRALGITGLTKALPRRLLVTPRTRLRVMPAPGE